MTLEEAKARMSQESLDHLVDITTNATEIDVSKKSCNDILMQALCNAVTGKVINTSYLDEKTVKMLNSPTNTLAEDKLMNCLGHVRQHQPNLHCDIIIRNPKLEIVRTWTFPGSSFIQIFDEVIKMFNITPHSVRQKMTVTLKSSIVNNIAQLVAKYDTLENKNDMKVSIQTIFRLVVMEQHTMTAEFKE